MKKTEEEMQINNNPKPPKVDEFSSAEVATDKKIAGGKPSFARTTEDKPSFAKATEGKKDEKEKKPISIRTYRGDLAGILKNKSTSMAGMVIAEEKKRGNIFSKVTKTAKKNIALSVISILLIVAGILSVFLLNYLKPTPIIKISDIVLETIIYSEYQRELFLEQPGKLKLTKLIQNEIDDINIPLGSLIHFYLTQQSKNEDAQVGKILLSAQQLLFLIDARVSETLLRFLEPNFMFGFHSSAGDRPFLLLKTRSFENSFSEMLKWEENMIEDLRSIFIEDNPVLSVNRLRETKYQFCDVVVRNKDARAILDGGGKILFIYSFADKNTIVITTNQTTLQEIFDRLTTSYRKR